jgi:hypothetical protein
MAYIVIRCHETLYGSSPPAAAVGEFIVIFPPGLLIALSAGKKHWRLIEEAILVDMYQAHMACILIRYR